MVLPKDQRLKGSENYNLWSSCLMVLLQSKGLEDHHKDDAKTYMCLNVNIDDEATLLIKDYDTAKLAWATLKAQYQGKGRNLQQKFLSKLISVKHSHFNSTSMYITVFKSIIANLKAVKEDIADESISVTSSSGAVMYGKNNSNSSNSKGSKDVKCNHCKKNGHKESDCFQKHLEKLKEYKAKQSGKKKEKKSEDKPKKSDSKDKSNTVNLNSASLVTASLVTANPTAFSMFTRNQWIADTSATDHITNNLNWFDSGSYSTCSDLHPMETGNSFTPIVSIGTVTLETTCSDGSSFLLTLTNVQYIPTFPVNIFGALRLLVQNGDARVTSSGIFNKNNIEYSAVITSPAGIYLRLASIPTALISTFLARQTIPSLDIIHQRLAYTSLEVVKNTIKATLGIDAELVKKASDEDPFLCEACEYGHSEKGVSRQPRKRSTKVGEVLNIDVCTVTPVSYNGHHYTTTIVDDYSGATWGYTHKEKKGAYDAIVTHCALLKNQWNITPKLIRINGGNEFGEEKLDTFCSHKGIQHEETTPHTPWQNGVSKRAEHSIFTRTHTIMIATSIPLTLWNKVYKSAIYIGNRLATRTLLNSTFEEVVQPTEEEEEVSEDELPQVVVPTKRGRGRPKGSKNKKPEQGHTNSDITHVDLTENRVTRLQAAKSSTQALSPVVSPSPVVSGAFPDEGEILGQPPAVAMAYGHCLTARSALNLGYALAVTDDPTELKSYKEALDTPYSQEWQDATVTELKSLVKCKTFKLTRLPPGKHALKGRWVYRIKRNADRQIERFKARFVVKGYEQRHGVDYDQTWASVVKSATWKVLMSVAAVRGWQIHQMDVVTAFLNGDIDVEIYIDLPEGFTVEDLRALGVEYADIDGDGHLVLLLLKSLYGLKQAPRCWQLKLNSKLAEIGFLPLQSDPSVFFNQRLSIFICTYVDDFLVIGPGGSQFDEVKRILHDLFEMIDMGPASWFLGVRIIRDWEKHTISLVQDGYVKKILDRFGYSNVKPHSTPFEANVAEFMVKYDGIATPQDVQLYSEKVGSVMYLMTQTRPDLSFPVSRLSQFLQNPSPQHLKLVKQVFQYLQGTQDVGITFGGDGNENLDFYGFSDSDYGGCLETRRSTIGYLFFLGGGPISWRCQRLPCVTLSTTEAEYCALSEASREAIWLARLLSELQVNVSSSKITLNGDNQGSLSMAETTEQSKRAKHIDIRYHFVREKVQSGEIVLNYVPTADMVADGLTKALNSVKHAKFMDLLGLKSIALNR
ncbi:hypothetical protein B7463_g5291, partial [Scytalidium lignicola]